MNVTSATYHFSKEKIDREAEAIRLAKSDPGKFDVLYNHYHEQIFMFIMKRVESEDAAADITSQVFLKALSNIGKYKEMGLPFASWLYRIARNEIYDQCAKNKIEMVVSVERKGIWDMVAQFGEEKKEEDFTRLHNALGTLDNDEIELIELRFFEERPFKEVAEILELTEGNTKMKTYRILEKLKNILKDDR
jgi:RNA polymerase sigma-70 factor (ECF subfamily)